MEQWKDVSGFEGLYQVSNTGKIKRLFKNGKERLLIGKKDRDGYVTVILSRNQNKKHCMLHRLIAEAFVPNTESKPQINHKDRNKQNNNVDNLEWVTVAENIKHCFLTGKRVHKRAVLQYTPSMKLVACWESIRSASQKLNIAASNISSCCASRLQTSGGYIWRYKESDAI